jgi:GNAT superfamily N-acetyltransferase
VAAPRATVRHAPPIPDGAERLSPVPDAIAGCGGWGRRRTLHGGDQRKAAEDPLLDPATEPARIRAFFVDPAWARRGVGSCILRARIDAARDAGFRALELVATLPGEPPYRAFGFEACERFDAPLPDGPGLPVVRMIRRVMPEPASLRPAP